ncbi:hypothetical protein GCM10010915_06530 [Microbacterium faecale]|uniref:Uncharacterized protein n=1 Tax=Microbacterium faecale TaxID=1804630 RepID=A0A916Y4B4_9MICO|nr:hypothetical protein GCM10010915_06530 [Microbacterium faecale]
MRLREAAEIEFADGPQTEFDQRGARAKRTGDAILHKKLPPCQRDEQPVRRGPGNPQLVGDHRHSELAVVLKHAEHAERVVDRFDAIGWRRSREPFGHEAIMHILGAARFRSAGR